MPRVVICLLAALAASVWLANSATAAPIPWCGGSEQAAADRPPAADATSPNQIHVVYATPSDGPDDFVVDAPLIAGDIAAVDGWWRGQDATRTPRFDLYPFSGCAPGFGQLDLSFVRLPQPASAYMDENARLDLLTVDLGTFALDDRVKTLVYYDGPVQDPQVCGTARYESARNGGRFGFAFVWLQACLVDLGSGGETARVAVHELLHNLGAVPQDAPHECPAPDEGHVCDSAVDILYPRVFRGDTLASAALDVGRDDYYGHAGSWWDVRNSLWLAHLPLRLLTVSVDGDGTVASSTGRLSCPPACSVAVEDGSLVDLDATPTTGHRLVGWSGACSGSATCEVTMDDAKNVSAVFGVAVYRLTVAVSGRGRVAGGSVACPRRCSVSLNGGTNVRLRATPAHGYRFAGWRGDCRGTGACLVRADRGHTVRASFVRR